MTTRVIFRTYRRGGDVIALFPDEPWDRNNVPCYQHLGQHGSDDYWGVLEQSRLSTPDEYAELYDEHGTARVRRFEDRQAALV